MIEQALSADCLPWVLVAFFLGFTGRNGVAYLTQTVESLPDVKSATEEAEKADEDEEKEEDDEKDE